MTTKKFDEADKSNVEMYLIQAGVKQDAAATMGIWTAQELHASKASPMKKTTR